MVGRRSDKQQRREISRRFRVTSQIEAVGKAHAILTTRPAAQKALAQLVQSGLDPDRVERMVAFAIHYHSQILDRLDGEKTARAEAEKAIKWARDLAGWVRNVADDLPHLFAHGLEAAHLATTLELIEALAEQRAAGEDFGARRASRATKARVSATGMLALGIQQASPKHRTHFDQVVVLAVAAFGGKPIDDVKTLTRYRASAKRATPGLVGDV
jgi:hypothetical protein